MSRFKYKIMSVQSMHTKILIAEDDPLLAHMYQVKLSREGYKVLIASDGQEAWEKVKSDKPQAMIMDVMMPRMTGIELLKKIRHSKKHADLPIVILSNSNSQSDKSEAKKLHVTDFLLKANYTPQQVTSILGKYLH